MRYATPLSFQVASRTRREPVTNVLLYAAQSDLRGEDHGECQRSQSLGTHPALARYLPPKIGIRPAIDGRRKGVRESLENQTMDMAKSAAKFFSGNLRHPNGLPVECVIADTCIGGVAEAAEAADKFARQGVGAFSHRFALLVLRFGDHGYGSADAQSGLGFQRHERPGRGLPGSRVGGAQSERAAGLRHLWKGRAGRGR